MEQLRRLFLGVPLSQEVRAMLAQHLHQYRVPGRPVPADNWHLTVRFLGNVGQVAMERLVAELDQAVLGLSFEIALGDLGAFPRPSRASVVWLALDQGRERLTELNDIAEEASQAVGLAPEERPFAPHLTLSRIQPELDVRADLASYRRVPLQWTAGELVLYESRTGRGGAVYEALEKFPFD
ncbi:MAG: RNA 2',3'-cyclic phosphodiesterase [Acidimicrobiia bacterium]